MDPLDWLTGILTIAVVLTALWLPISRNSDDGDKRDG
jgi:hypothetical protein